MNWLIWNETYGQRIGYWLIIFSIIKCTFIVCSVAITMTYYEFVHLQWVAGVAIHIDKSVQLSCSSLFVCYLYNRINSKSCIEPFIFAARTIALSPFAILCIGLNSLTILFLASYIGRSFILRVNSYRGKQ